MTFYQGTENLPEFTDYNMADRTYRYTDKNVLYPSDTDYIMAESVMKRNVYPEKGQILPGEVKVSASVINEGKYALWETVQVYVKKGITGL